MQISENLNRLRHPIVIKLGGILLILLLLKLLMIGTGLFAARHLMGDATAINYAGSERMRSFKIGLLLDYWLDTLNDEGVDSALAKDKADREIDTFERILYGLRDGDKGLGLPRLNDKRTVAQLNKVIDRWKGEVRPLLEEIEGAKDPETAHSLLTHYNTIVYDFVSEIDEAVALYEDYSNWKVKMFDLIQYLFLILTVLVTALAIYLIFKVINKPISKIKYAISRFTEGDFGVRVKDPSDDEIGELARGFNYMAERLESSYRELEESITSKTKALRDKNRALSILYDVASFTNSPLPMDRLLEGVLNRLLRLLDADAGAIRLFDKDKRELCLLAHTGLSQSFIKEEEILPVDGCTCGISVNESRIICLDHSSECFGEKEKRCLKEGFASMVVVPLRYQEKVVGTYNLFFHSLKGFKEGEKDVLNSIGNHLGLAVENSMLRSKALHLAAMEERVLIANELHDSIAQSLAFLKIQAKLLEGSLSSGDGRQRMEDLKQMQKGIEECNQNVRELLSHFRTRLESDGLEATIKKYLVKFRKETGIETTLHATANIPFFSPDAEIHVFHIVQEALSNVRKYAGASKVTVSINANGGFELVVDDNGRGFDVDAVQSDGFNHVGLDIMRERAGRLGGFLKVESEIGKGTRVSLVVP